jgi:hypothetical protein
MILPLLSAADRPFFPTDSRCPRCGHNFSQGFAYLSAGALLLSPDGQDSIETDRLRAFLHIGFHGKDSSMADSSGVSPIVDLHGGQFDLQWCSVRCMRESVLDVLERIEAEANGVSREIQ